MRNKKNSVNFYGFLSSSTGYGKAVENFAKAFSLSNINTKFIFDKKDKTKNKINNLNLRNYTGKCNVEFHLSSPPYKKNRSSNYRIAYFYWETDMLPSPWVKHLKELDELWVPCKLVEGACRKAGFKNKIRVVPTPHDEWSSDIKLSFPSSFSNEYFISDNVLKFYSIFQWHYRKGPDILLKSYWKEFKRNDSVLLVLKVSPLNVGNYDANKINKDIASIKSSLNLPYYAPIYIINDIISEKYIKALHNNLDCYVATHRGEGWGIPIQDAIYAGNPVITTRFGGVTEWLSVKNAGIIKHRPTHVSRMEWSPHIYNAKQKWASPSIDSSSKLMRDVYLNFDDYAKKSIRAKKIIDRFSIKKVSRLIESYIGEI
jgi:hypothetical protein